LQKEAEQQSRMDRSPVTHNEAKGQFEIALGNESAILQYRGADAGWATS
jgi:hypothetical protein